MALLNGSVHGVVVQMTADTTLSFPGKKTLTSIQCLEWWSKWLLTQHSPSMGKKTHTHINTVPGVWSKWLPTQHSPSLGKKHTLTSIQCLECGPNDCRHNSPSLGKNTHTHINTVPECGPDDCWHNTLLPWGKKTPTSIQCLSVVQVTADTTLSFPGEKTLTSIQCLECGPDDYRHNTLLPWEKNAHIDTVQSPQQPNSAVSTPPRWIFIKRANKGDSRSSRITCNKNTVSLLESREQSYIKAVNKPTNQWAGLA